MHCSPPSSDEELSLLRCGPSKTTRDWCSEPVPERQAFRKEKLKFNSAFPIQALTPSQTPREKYSEDMGSKTVRCEPRLRTGTWQNLMKSHSRALLMVLPKCFNFLPLFEYYLPSYRKEAVWMRHFDCTSVAIGTG